jgi:probable HAF family extracellular repeat protein
MKSKTLTSFAVVTLSAATLAVAVEAARAGSTGTPPVLYVVKDLGTLGGSGADGTGVNARGWVVGLSHVAGVQSEHAFLWRDGAMTDLGTLGGLNSFALPVSNNGTVAVSAETASPDPLSENFCPFALANVPPTSPTGLTCLGALWRDGALTALPTLGGTNGVAAGINSRGQVVGYAETSTKDPTCAPPQVLDYYGVVWGPRKGEIQALPPLPGDTVSLAANINERGQVVGQSGPCISLSGLFVGVFLPRGVIWEKGQATNLGSLGGALATFPYSINNQGQVVGQSNLTGDAVFHAFLWQKGAMADLGVLPGDIASIAFGLNDPSQAVGTSFGPNFSTMRAFLWQNGVMTDLNTLLKPGSTSLYLLLGNAINARGEITGQAFNPSTGEFRAYLAIPCDAGHANDAGCLGGSESATAAALNTRPWLPSPSPQGVRALLLTRGEFALLRVFVTRPGRVLSRDMVLNALGDRRFEPFDRSVDQQVARLRRKIEPDPKEPRLIVTVPGEGYRFDGLTKTLGVRAQASDGDPGV